MDSTKLTTRDGQGLVVIVVVLVVAVGLVAGAAWYFFRRAPSPPPGQVVKQLSAAEQPPTFPVGLPPVEEAQLLQNVTVQKAGTSTVQGSRQFLTPLSAEAAYELYRDDLSGRGWQIGEAPEENASKLMRFDARKGDQFAAVEIQAMPDGQTRVSLNFFDKSGALIQP